MSMSPKQSPMAKDRTGFTLVELLVVITIIGAIAALAIPAIGNVMKSVRQSAMQTELTLIDSAVENYRTKHGDYPPDFVDWNLTKRHYLKIFPDIANSELDLLFRMCDNIVDSDPTQMTTAINTNNFNPTAMDRAEALAWSLGGFSSDPQYPFTGTGGPLVLWNNEAGADINDPLNYQYNTTRTAAEMEFKPGQLSILSPDPNLARPIISSAASPAVRPVVTDNRFRSGEEIEEGRTQQADLFPTYVLREGASPVVYFDARTYAYNASPTGSNYNGYVRPNVADSASGFDAVRPVFSATQGLVPSSGSYGNIPTALTGWQFSKPQSFQVHAPGLDGLYGAVADADYGTDPTNELPLYFQVTGNVIIPSATANTPAALRHPDVARFDLTGLNVPTATDPDQVTKNSSGAIRDNICNFLSGRFEDEIE